MSATATFVTALVALLAVGVATWAWFAIAEVEEQLRSFNGFDGMQFDIGPPAVANAEGAT